MQKLKDLEEVEVEVEVEAAHHECTNGVCREILKMQNIEESLRSMFELLTPGEKAKILARLK